MLTISQVSKAYAGKTLFSDIALQVNRTDRIGLVGPNGAGKSTLFSLILGENSPDTGTIELERGSRLGFLPQESAPVGGETVLQLATAVTPDFLEVRRRIDAFEAGEGHDVDQYHLDLDRFAQLDGQALEPAAKKILAGLAFRESDFDRPASELSGGWIMRAHLARLLVMKPDLLMLDEPTNHLDLESLRWLQSYLKTYPGAILMISHDREFLNELVDYIVDIRAGSLNRYRGNYDSYLEQRAAREEQHEAAYDNQQKEIQRLQRFADRFRAKASKATQAQSKLKQIDRMVKIAPPRAAEATIKFRFPQPARSGHKVIELKNIHHAYGQTVVYSGVDFLAERGQRTVLVGPNGAGKSTLIKLLAGVLPVTKGERILGMNVRAGYFSQNRVEMFDSDHTVLEEALFDRGDVKEESVRTLLGCFLFREEDVGKKVSVLSGGEKSRLALVKLLINPPNFLLMDEPTTHLDMASIDALIQALEQYAGTLIFISHDVHFIKSIASSVLHVSGGRLTYYPGGYEYFLQKTETVSEREGLTAGERPAAKAPAAKNGAGRDEAAGGSSFKTRDQRRREAAERQARREKEKGAERVAAKIIELEERQRELTAKLEDPAAYEPGGNASGLNRELAEVVDKIKTLTADWEKLVEEAG